MKFVSRKICYLLVIIILITAVGIFTPETQEGFGGSSVRASTENPGLTLIIDPGHGGEDGGAVSLSGAKESEINLDIALKLDQIMGFFGVQVVMTRDTEELDYSENANSIREKKVEDQNKRLRLINETENAALISIHQNKFPDESPFGAQVLFAPTDGSKAFAEYMQKAVINALNAKNRRAAAKVPSNVLLLNHIKCPAILIECGFLSNFEEERLLLTDEYKLKVAAVIAAGFIYNQDTLIDINNVQGGTNEG